MFRLFKIKENKKDNSDKLKIVYISGEPNTPGHEYRVLRPAASLQELGHEVFVYQLCDISRALKKHKRPNIVIIWRAGWSTELSIAFQEWRRAGSKIGYDVDDYMIDPLVARTEIIDGIRSQGFDVNDIRLFYEKINTALVASDFGITTTNHLATAMRRFGKPAFVIPNGYSVRNYTESRKAMIELREKESEGIVRIGYASGSKTHQKDFREASKAIANILKKIPYCRLVLFRNGDNSIPILDIKEFPEFEGLYDRIEWRSFVPLNKLCHEIARFDINIAPLELNNIFCESKSEIKYWEAAMVEVPTVASPTEPYSSCIKDGQTGNLAASQDQWEEALEKLVLNKEYRRNIGLAARNDILWMFGPEKRRELTKEMICRVLGDGHTKAQSYKNKIVYKESQKIIPRLVDHKIIYRYINEIPDVSVVITNYNYSNYIIEAFESIAFQTQKKIELIVVDDCSTDCSEVLINGWLQKNKNHFSSVLYIINTINSGISNARNIGFSYAEADYIFPLDADNRLTATCLEKLLLAISTSHSHMAHPSRQRFGDDNIMCKAEPWSPDKLMFGNYIDAMSLIKKTTWARCGGYDVSPVQGWEDYELWCNMIEEGMWSIEVPEAICEYRVHGESMLHKVTNLPKNKEIVKNHISNKYSWTDI